MSVDHAYGKGSEPGSRPELETANFDLDSPCVYFDRAPKFIEGCSFT